jgi:hypothetical protein
MFRWEDANLTRFSHRSFILSTALGPVQVSGFARNFMLSVVNNLRRRGVPVEYILFPDEGHGWRKGPESRTFHGGAGGVHFELPESRYDDREEVGPTQHAGRFGFLPSTTTLQCTWVPIFLRKSLNLPGSLSEA